ncbi:MAG: prepilin-type N-terminal cleavage/methylation domain-containing protein, partial [Planctomycetales bacterium]|nr:prepilin-type N-terminal cleavage/methylation domain-containing protein [Planctomycetales bacterium]NIP69107.1 prepilin-type N-terminal cleavage/methylation domain-containing protein [Planctomycetales bacterium]
MSRRVPPNRRRGLTLLELLVVLFIVSILLAVAIPVFRIGAEGRSIREAARIVSSALNTARAR